MIIEYSYKQVTTQSSSFSSSYMVGLKGVWVRARDGMPNIQSVDAVFVQKINHQGQCGYPSSNSETVYYMNLPNGQFGFYSPGKFKNDRREEFPAELTISSNGYCYSESVINEIAVVLTDLNGYQTWLVDPVTGIHNFRLMF